MESQAHLDLRACNYFGVALDESGGIQAKPKLAIFRRSVSNDCLIKKELVDIVPLKDKTRSIDVTKTTMAAFLKANPRMGRQSWPDLRTSLWGCAKLSKHFTRISTESSTGSNLSLKSFSQDNVIKSVMEIVNYIRKHALNHRQFKNLIAELDQGLPGDLPLQCIVRWLSKGQASY